MNNNFIPAEEFLKQSKEVQENLIEWWNPQIGNLTTGKTEHIVVIQQPRDVEAVKIYKGKMVTPLLQMHQLVNFIEDKTKCKVELDCYGEKGYEMFLYSLIENNKTQYPFNAFRGLGFDLLNALWQVAIQIAK